MNANTKGAPQPRSGKRERVARGARGIGDAVAANPFAAIAGAAAVSAGLALLLPASRREIELTGDIADRIEEAARDAADSVKAAGRAQVETLAQTALAGIGGAVIEQVVANSDGGAPQKSRDQPSTGKPGAA